MPIHELFSALAIALTFIAFYPYIRSVKSGKVKPHVFSWIIWGVTTLIVFIAQLEDGAGVGAWPIGLSAIITLYVAYLAYLKRSDISITSTDWVFFISAILSIPLWYITQNPLWSVILLTSIDIIGFAPTIRKAYLKPHEEQLTFFFIMAVRNGFSIIALENYSVTTIIFPAAIAIACCIFITVVIWRR